MLHDLRVMRHFFVRQKTKKRTKSQQFLPYSTIYNSIQDFRIKRKEYFLSERRKNSIEHESRHIMILWIGTWMRKISHKAVSQRKIAASVPHEIFRVFRISCGLWFVESPFAMRREGFLCFGCRTSQNIRDLLDFDHKKIKMKEIEMRYINFFEKNKKIFFWTVN